MKYQPKKYALITKAGKIIQKNIDTLARAELLQSQLMPNCPCNIMRANGFGKLQFVAN